MKVVCQLAVAALILCGSLPASAEGLNLSGSTKSRLAIFESQADLIDRKLKKQYSGSVKHTPKYKKGEETAVAVAGIPA